jgi:Flp pilus assembly protein TadB
MELSLIIPIVAGVIFVGSLGLLVYATRSRRSASYRNLMVNVRQPSENSKLRSMVAEDDTGEALEQVSVQLKKKMAKKPPVTLQDRMFRAGIFTEQQKKDYARLRTLCPMIAIAIGLGIGLFVGGPDIIFLCAVAGGVLGLYVPLTILDRREKARSEEILFYLPLVIEQISIGVSSSLDVGPCVQRIVQMADERDSHNPVTELLRFASYYVKSGASFEESLAEIGRLSGHNDLKHTFMALCQVAKFGGEISRQLQELADSVGALREARVEEKIKKLELSATVPVALVFFGYLVILLVGFGLQIITVF